MDLKGKRKTEQSKYPAINNSGHSLKVCTIFEILKSRKINSSHRLPMTIQKPMPYSVLKISLGFGFLIFLTLTWPFNYAAAQSTSINSNTNAPQTNQPLQETVKIIVNSETNQITLIGNAADIAIVKRAINAINRIKPQPPSSVISKKVVLHRQLSENVATAIRNAQPLLTNRQGKLTITALHTPEAIFLSGPPALVERATKFIATFDHPTKQD